MEEIFGDLKRPPCPRPVLFVSIQDRDRGAALRLGRGGGGGKTASNSILGVQKTLFRTNASRSLQDTKLKTGTLANFWVSALVT